MSFAGLSIPIGSLVTINILLSVIGIPLEAATVMFIFYFLVYLGLMSFAIPFIPSGSLVTIIILLSSISKLQDQLSYFLHVIF